MWKYISIFTSLILFSLAVLANDDAEIQLINKKKVELSPGSNFNVALRLINNSDSEKEFHLKISTPQGWSQLVDYSSVIVEKQSAKLKIFSFYVQETTMVGDYIIGIKAFTSSGNTTIGSVDVPVYVKPKYGIQTKIMNKPEYVIAGDTLSVEFMVQNLSNTEANISVEIRNLKVVESSIYKLGPDSVVFVRVFVVTRKDIIRYYMQSVSLTASIIESPETTSAVSGIFDVLPSSKVKFDAYNRIPTRVSGLFVTDNNLGDRKYGAMFDIRGAGMLTKKNDRRIEYHFRGPNRQGNPTLGQTDEYYVKYSSIKSNAVVGDNSYSLTPLTEGARGGRGVGYEHQLKKLGVGAFVNFPRFYPSVNRVISAYGTYKANEKLKLLVGYLNKAFITNNSAQLFTISGESSPFSWAAIEFEVAAGMAYGKTTLAYSTALNLRYSRYRVFFNYIKANVGFPGYLTNSKQLSVGINTTFLRKIGVTINYNLNHFNIALDTMYSNAPYSTNLVASIGYQLNYFHSFNIGVSMRGREDMSLIKQFHYKELTARIGLKSRIKRFDLNVYGAIGKTENLLIIKEGELTNVLNMNLSMRYSIGDNISASGFVTYQGGQQYLTNDFTRFLYGGRVIANWKNKIATSLQYQNNYEVEDYYRDRSIFSLDIMYLLNKHHEFGINVNYDLRKNELNETRLSARLNYTYTINIPVSKREDIGSFHGKVINNGVENIDGIMFTLMGNSAITDKNGEFDFPVVKTGTYFLFMDYSNSGLNSITEEAGPYKIEILPSQKYQFEVSLTKSAEITGSVVIEEDENAEKKGFVGIKEEVRNLIIEVKKGDEVFRMFTKNDKSFHFQDLRPGEWIFKVYDRGIPKGYKIVNNEINVNLVSGEVKNINVIIKKISRRIKFQKKY